MRTFLQKLQGVQCESVPGEVEMETSSTSDILSLQLPVSVSLSVKLSCGQGGFRGTSRQSTQSNL